MDSARASLHSVELSPRELEVAVLAGMGYSSKYVARHLCISPRTVEAHINRIYGKMGVSSRDELIEMLSGKPDL